MQLAIAIMNRAVRLVWYCALATAASGCAQLFGVDQYARGGDGGAAAQSAGANAAFAPMRFLSGDECISCLSRECESQRETCAGDAFCTDFEQRAQAPDPVTEPLVSNLELQTRWADSTWDTAAHDAPDIAAAERALHNCAQDRCRPQCTRNYGCVGQFDWAASYPKDSTLRFRYVDWFDPSTTLSGWTIRACAPSNPDCSPALGSATTNEKGLAELRVDLMNTVVPRPEFDGYLLTEGNSAYPPALIQHTRPFWNGTYFTWSWVRKDVIQSLVDAKGVTWSDTILYVQTFDCSALYTQGTTIDVWSANNEGYARCDSCRVVYSDANALPDPTLTQSFGILAFVIGVPIGEIMVVVRDAESQKPISVLRSVYTRPGYAHVLSMFPASKSELARLPEVAR